MATLIRSMSPVVMAWALLSAVTVAPYLRASLAPPRGTVFVGFFSYVDDQFNYLSYVEQAERGHFLFSNKLVLEPNAPALINLEWWAVGRLSRILGGHPFVAYRVVWMAASLALLAGVDRWLSAGGLPAANRFAALLLVGLGAGFGGLAWRFDLSSLYDAADLSMGIFPFVELLANPHFVVGTALATWALYLLSRPRRAGMGILLGTVVALVRPYDAALLVMARTVAVVAEAPIREWISKLWPLLALAPSFAYLGWVFYLLPAFGSFGNTYAFPAWGSLCLALGPATVLALTALWARRARAEARAAQLHLAGWAMSALAIGLSRPVGFSLQFLVGVGVPLLSLGGLGLGRWPRASTLLATALLCTTPAIALSLMLGDSPRWFVPSSHLEVAWTLRKDCRDGDILFAPELIGLYALGLSACKAVLAHSQAPAYAANAILVSRFYTVASPSERSAMLDGLRVTHLALPGDAGISPTAWLGEGTRFRRFAYLSEQGGVSIYNRREVAPADTVQPIPERP